MASAVRAEDSSSASVNPSTPSGITEEALSPARNAALRLVSRAEQCTFLLTQKLLKKGFDIGTVKAVVLELVETNIVNDDRFSQMWVRSRIASKPDTPRRITAALCAKGIDRGTAARALEECLDPETEEALLRRFVQKRLKNLPLETGAYHAELRGEGFSQDAVRGFLESKDFEAG
jgi:regulatory protein